MFCSYCGKSVKDGSKFCVYCGQRLAKDEAENVRTGQPEKMRSDAYRTDRLSPQSGARNIPDPHLKGYEPQQSSGRHYYSSERKARQVEFQTDEIMRQTDIQLEQRARQADIQREQQKLSGGIRPENAAPAEQGTGRLYNRQPGDRRPSERQPFEGKNQRSDEDKKRSRLPLLIVLIAVIAAAAVAAVLFFVVPMFTSSGAEATITKLEEALNERDNYKLLECFDRETNALGEDAFTSRTARASYDLKLYESSETDSEHMKAYVTFNVRYNDEYSSELVPLPMVKEGRNWYITKDGWDKVCAEIPKRD